MNRPDIQRRSSRAVAVGHLTIGGDSPVTVQSMTNTATADAEATLAQVQRLAEAGAELVRVATPTDDDTAALRRIVDESPVPIVADVHFHFARAIEAIDAGVAKIRLNPGNLADRDQVRRVIDAAGAAGCAIRVGVNEGSIIDRRDADRRAEELRRPLVELMVEKLGEYLQPFDEAGFDRLALSAKSADAVTTIAVNRALAERWDWPLHLGVTHAGTARSGAIRSAAALGALLAEGIGDTIRISFAGDPVEEVLAGRELLASLRLRDRRGVELIACPTCGRLQMDLAGLIDQAEAALAEVQTTQPLTVAIMGCVVNGPGEADCADIAFCAGKGKLIVYRRGERIETITPEQLIETMLREVRSLNK